MDFVIVKLCQPVSHHPSQELPLVFFLLFFFLSHCMTPTAASSPLLRDLPSCPRGHLLVWQQPVSPPHWPHSHPKKRQKQKKIRKKSGSVEVEVQVIVFFKCILLYSNVN